MTCLYADVGKMPGNVYNNMRVICRDTRDNKRWISPHRSRERERKNKQIPTNTLPRSWQSKPRSLFQFYIEICLCVCVCDSYAFDAIHITVILCVLFNSEPKRVDDTLSMQCNLSCRLIPIRHGWFRFESDFILLLRWVVCWYIFNRTNNKLFWLRRIVFFFLLLLLTFPFAARLLWRFFFSCAAFLRGANRNGIFKFPAWNRIFSVYCCAVVVAKHIPLPTRGKWFEKQEDETKNH